MPALPSALYLAEGLSITSILSMLSAGSCCSISARLSLVSPLALPLIHTSTLVLPRSDMLPSVSTSTEGMFSSTSLAAPPALLMSCVTSNDLRSTSSLIDGRCAVTVTSCSVRLSSDMCTTLRLACLCCSSTSKLFSASVKPMYESFSV